MNTRDFSLLIILLILLAAVGCRQGVEIGELQTKSETVELGDGESEVTLSFDIEAAVGEINLEAEPAPAAAEPAPAAEAPADEEEAQEEEVAMFDEDIAAQLQAVLEAAVASPDTNYPGVVLHVSSPELGSWGGAAGLGEVEANTAMRPHDRFRAGSLTKPFISVVILQLVEDGLFSLDDLMTAVLPESITGKFANSDQITVRMLLNHTGGLPDFMDLAGPEIVANLEKIWEEEEFLDIAAAQEPWFAPGEAQGYSNTDYTLLGMIIEEATGRTWREETRERIFEPLNLENTLLPEPDDVTIPGDHAHGYNDFGAGVVDATELANPSVVGAAGGQSLVTNAEDLSRYVTALAAGELFQEAGTMEEMLTFVAWPDGNPLSPYVDGYGLGVLQAAFGSGIGNVGHSGNTAGGYNSFVFYLPAQDMTISGAVNTEDFKAGYLLIPRALEVLLPGYTVPEQPAPIAQQELTPELLAKFEAYVEQNRESLNVPGAAVAIVQGGEIVYAEGFGVKELGSDDPVTADTVFSIGSTTKALTSMMAASLVDDGLIEWDTPLVEVMPQFQLSDEGATQQITLREAFAHTSGLPNTDLVLFFSERPEEYIEYLADVPLAASPGEAYAYHNQMYALGGYAAAMAAGAEYGENLFPTYADLMQERVFDPLGMTSATFSAQEAVASPNHATPHFMSLNGTLAETGFDVTPTHYWDLDAIAPSGTARMSAPDVGRFLITMLSGGVAPDGSRAISAENLAETWTEQIPREPDPYLEQKGSALGWSTITYQGIPIVSKDGSIDGFFAQMAFIPEADAGIVVLSNADVTGSMLGRNAQYRFIEMLFGLEPLIDEVAATELEGIGGASDLFNQLAAVDPETVTPFLGSYDMEGTSYTVELRDDRLWVSVGDWDFLELLAAPDGSYMAISGGSDFLFAPFQFVEAEDGSITMVIFEQLELPNLD